MKLITVDWNDIRDRCIADARADRAYWRANSPRSVDDDLAYIRVCEWPVEGSYSTLAPGDGDGLEIMVVRAGAMVMAALIGALVAWML